MAHLEIHTRAVALEKPVLLASCFFVPTVLGPWLYGFQSDEKLLTPRTPKEAVVAFSKAATWQLSTRGCLRDLLSRPTAVRVISPDAPARPFARALPTPARAHARVADRASPSSGSSAPPPAGTGLLSWRSGTMMATMAVQAPAARLDASRAARSTRPARVPAQSPRRRRRAGGPRARDVRRPAWLGDLDARQLRGRREEGWREEGRRVFAPCQARRRGRERQNERRKARRGLDPDLFAGAERVAAVPSGDRAGRRAMRAAGDDERPASAARR